jgi:hypothetical protein
LEIKDNANQIRNLLKKESMPAKRNPTMQVSGRSRNRYSSPFTKRAKTKSRSATKCLSVGIFRPDLLDYNPIEKSGYSSLKIDLPEEEQFLGKVSLATEWHKCLKKHENYQPILIDSESTIDIVFQLLHNETERLLKGYSWVLKIEADEEPKLIYYNSLGDVSNYNVPLDWIYKHKIHAIRNAGLWLIKQLSAHFGIDTIYNDTLEMCIENWQFEEDDDWTVINHVKEQLDNGEPRDKIEIYEAVANIFSYKHGKPKELKELLRDMMWTYDEGYYKRVVIDNLPHEEDWELRDWLLSGHELLKLDSIKIEDFKLSPDDMNGDNGDMVSVDQSVFFPYSTTDYIYNEYSDWLDSTANGIGVNDFFNHGFLTAKSHAKPENPEPLLQLLKFLEQGQKIHKQYAN